MEKGKKKIVNKSPKREEKRETVRVFSLHFVSYSSPDAKRGVPPGVFQHVGGGGSGLRSEKPMSKKKKKMLIYGRHNKLLLSDQSMPCSPRLFLQFVSFILFYRMQEQEQQQHGQTDTVRQLNVGV